MLSFLSIVTIDHLPSRMAAVTFKLGSETVSQTWINDAVSKLELGEEGACIKLVSGSHQ